MALHSLIAGETAAGKKVLLAWFFRTQAASRSLFPVTALPAQPCECQKATVLEVRFEMHLLHSFGINRPTDSSEEAKNLR